MELGYFGPTAVKPLFRPTDNEGKQLDQRKVARLRVGAKNRRKVEAIHTLSESARRVPILLQEEMFPKNKHAFRLRSYWMFT